jgi:FkbM family methyltransferase
MKFKNPLNFLKKANRSFNLYLENYEKINTFFKNYKNNQKKTNQLLEAYGETQQKTNTYLEAFLDICKDNQDRTDKLIQKYDKNQKQTNNSLNTILDTYNNNQEKTNQLIQKYDKNHEKINYMSNSFVSVKENLEKAIEIFNKNYYISKEYFFNGDEDSFKMMDTDHFFQMCFFNNIKLLSYSPSENRIYLKTEDGIILSTNNRFYTIKEIFAHNGYSVPQINLFKEFVVFDIGMNRGYASLKFANYESCKEVYGFEINNETYNFALENFNLNPTISHKIKPYNFGLSNVDEEVDIYCLPGSDGVTTTEPEFTDYQYEWIKGKKDMKIKKAKVKKAGSVIADIINNNQISSNIILKIDTEGSEQKIIDDLINKGILDRIDLIIGESHLKSGTLDNKLTGFKNVYKNYHNDIIYSFCYVKEKFYKVLPLSKIY